MAFSEASKYIESLWIAPASPDGYLARWFPKIGRQAPQAIPLTSSLNVIYGQNGSGKSQLLSSIIAASSFRMSAFEGFILKDFEEIDWTAMGLGQGKAKPIFGDSQQILEYYSSQNLKESELGERFFGFTGRNLDSDKFEIALTIIKEFRADNRLLLTRAITGNPDSFPHDSKPEDINNPYYQDLVPVLLPTSQGEVTRFWAKKIRESFLALYAEMLPINDSIIDSWDANDEVAADQFEELMNDRLDKWLDEWSWNPLVNRRNFPYLRDYRWVGWLTDDYGPLDHLNVILLDGKNSNLLYLPAIESRVTHWESNDFTAFPSANVLDMTLETGVESKTLGEFPSKHRKFSVLNETELKSKVNETILEIKDLLSFLPNFRHLVVHEVTNYDEVKEGTKYLFKLEMPRSTFIGNRVSIHAASSAEKRWFSLALRALLADRNSWIVIDEPENGLHRSAEHRMALALNSHRWQALGNVVIATHSPEFIGQSENVLHINDGKVIKLTEARREEIEVLGLRPSDLLTNVRSFLLVEGEHEKIIFELLLGDELRKLRCHIVVARGGKNMKDVFESQVIFDFSDAQVMCLLDNTNTENVNQLWSASKLLAKTNMEEAFSQIRRALPRKKSGENRFLSEFMQKALASGETDRISVHGMSKADILLYLDPKFFGIKTTWETILEELGDEQSLKSLAKEKYGADFSTQKIRDAAASLESIPDDFKLLLLALDT